MNITSGAGYPLQSLSLETTASARTIETGQVGALKLSALKQSTEKNSVRAVAGPGGETNQISVAGRLMQASAGEDVRAERVAALQQAIAAGTYSVPAFAVANKLMESMVG